MTRYRSTHPSRYFERQARDPKTHDERLMTWRQPSWLERNGDVIAAAIGGLIIGSGLLAVLGMTIFGRFFA